MILYKKKDLVLVELRYYFRQIYELFIKYKSLYSIFQYKSKYISLYREIRWKTNKQWRVYIVHKQKMTSVLLRLQHKKQWILRV